MPTGNRHEQQRRTTRESLRRAALDRFARQGFDTVTVADVAADVGVTERTFYRHFETKEAVLFKDYETRLEWLAAALALRPDDEPLLDQIAAAVRAFPGDTEVVRQAALLRTAVVPRALVHDALQKVQAQFAAEIRAHVRRRLDGHEQADLLATVAGSAIAGALISVVDLWGQRQARKKADIEEILATAFAFMRSGFELSGRRGRARPRARSYSRG